MIAPKWLNTSSQPIAIRNVIEFLSGVLLNEKTYGKSYDIGGPDILTYKEMLLKLARVRGSEAKSHGRARHDAPLIFLLALLCYFNQL